MGWTTPVDRSTGYVVTATDWNATGQDDLTFLFGDTGWTNVSSFTNSYTNFTGFTTRFILLGRVVWIQGVVTGGTVNTSAFTLPVGYRPTQTMTWAVPGNNAFCQLQILTSGAVTPVTTGTAVNVNVSFPVV